jgi:hypothetical protein
MECRKEAPFLKGDGAFLWNPDKEFEGRER